MSKTWLLLRKRSSVSLVAALAPLIAAAQLSAQLSIGVERPVSPPALETHSRVSRLDAATTGENVFIVWVDDRTDRGSEIVATRLDRFGVVRDPAGIPLTSTPGVSEDLPLVEVNGVNFVVLWYAEGNTIAATVNGSGVIIDGPKVLAPGRPQSLIPMDRDLAVAISTSAGTTISLLRADLSLGELIDLPRRTSVQVARLGTGLLAVWTEFEFPSGLGVVKAMRIDNRGRTIDTVTVTQVGTFDGQPQIVLKGIGTDVILAAASGKKLAVARVKPDGTITLLHSVTDSNVRTVEDIVQRSDGFDLLATVGGKARILRFTADALATESTPMPGTASDGAGVITTGRVYTIWNIDGSVQGRFAFATSTELPVLISRTAPSQQLPGLATDGSSVLAVWSEDITETTDRVVARLLAADGSNTPSSQTLTLSGRSLLPSASGPVVSYTNGNYAVAWLDQKRGLDKPAQLTLELVSRNGAPGTETAVSTSAHFEESPAIANDLLVWTEKLIVTTQVKAALVSQPSHDFDIPDTVSEPAVVFGNNVYLVAGETANGAVRATLVSTAGTIDRMVLDTQPPFGSVDSKPAVAWNGRSHYLLVFRRNTSIYARLLDKDANPLGNTFAIVEGGIDDNPQVAWDGYGFVVTWTSRPIDNAAFDGDVYATRVLPNGTIELPVAISATERNDDYPALLGLGFGRTLIAYQRMAGELQNVHRIYTRVLVSKPQTTRRRSVR